MIRPWRVLAWICLALGAVTLLVAFTLPARAADDVERALAVNSQVDVRHVSAPLAAQDSWRRVYVGALAADLGTTAWGLAEGHKEGASWSGAAGGSSWGALAVSAGLGAIVYFAGRYIERQGGNPTGLYALGSVVRVGSAAHNVRNVSR